jgi:hypothetical protein
MELAQTCYCICNGRAEFEGHLKQSHLGMEIGSEDLKSWIDGVSAMS